MPQPGARRRYEVEINLAYCKGCNICVQICPKDVLALNRQGKAVAERVDECTGCDMCVIYCPDFAVTVEEVALHA